jgi:hypothetical protein
MSVPSKYYWHGKLPLQIIINYLKNGGLGNSSKTLFWQ